MNHQSRKAAALLIAALFLGVLPLFAADNRTNNTSAPPPVEQYYPIDNAVHWIGLVMDSGAKVKLEDGSIWEIAAKDQFQTRNWLTAQKIIVSRNANDRYPFRLTNAKITADARLVSRP